MAMGNNHGFHGSVAEINVTPLIDVLLVLLIIFMVIVPVAPQGLDALLPQRPQTLTEFPTPQPIVVQILSGKDGQPSYKINQESFVKAAIGPRLGEIFRTRQQKIMFIKGDPGLLYSSIAEVVDLGHEAGVDNVGIITRDR